MVASAPSPHRGLPAGPVGTGPWAGADGCDEHRCPVCRGPVEQRRSASGRRSRGRPRVFCSDRCRLGERRPEAEVEPGRLKEEREAFAAAVRSAIGESDRSLRDLTARLVADYGSLASSVATLSAWQTGSSAPPRTPVGVDRVLALERCLGRPAGELALLLPGGVVPPARRSARAGGAAGRHSALRHVTAALAGSQQVVPVTVSKERRLGLGRQPLHTRVGMRIRALHDGVDRFWYVHSPDPRLRSRPLGGTGCRVGREVAEPLGGGGFPLVAVELLFDRTLARGDHHDFSFAVDYDDARQDGQHHLGRSHRVPASVFRHLQAQPCERLELAVDFPAEATPAQLLQCRWRPGDLAEVWRSARTLDGRREYRLVLDDPAPGGHGYRWVWPAAAIPGARRSGASAA